MDYDFNVFLGCYLDKSAINEFAIALETMFW
jgi:hypothetical protein